MIRVAVLFGFIAVAIGAILGIIDICNLKKCTDINILSSPLNYGDEYFFAEPEKLNNIILELDR